jgi:hypothetical protein
MFFIELVELVELVELGRVLGICKTHSISTLSILSTSP